ncbi:MAG: hypothetical protein KME64_07480 [Scytonematopsis contorta HA4267-MV1]|jgi:hypothetical protein|nr:hypothetical protein [Scytonematopsis contorta HA4267-MV1]
MPEFQTIQTRKALQQWLPKEEYQRYITLLMQRVGMTQRRAECFVQLWLYLFLKDCQTHKSSLLPPVTELAFPQGWVECSCREAAELFYEDQERGSDRSAGMMLDKLEALGLIRKTFNGNCTQIEIQSLPELLFKVTTEARVCVKPDAFDPHSDAIPIANMLASNYNWLNHNTDALAYRIANILRDWTSLYSTGMRVLRRDDNQNPVGFYALIPIARESEIKFFSPPKQGLHLSQATSVDPFEIAQSGDKSCRSVFVRSWMIDNLYRKDAQISFLEDSQKTLALMKEDFPNLWDMYTLIIHPSYEELAIVLGFQKNGTEPKTSIYWMYQSVNRFLGLDMSLVDC